MYKAATIYSLGLILFTVSLFAPAYSPYGAWEYTGLDAFRGMLRLRPRMLLDFTRLEDIIAIVVIVIAGLNSVFVVLSPLLYPFRGKFHHSRWFLVWVITGVTCTIAIVLYMKYAGFIQVRYGYYVWLASIILVYMSFHPKLK